MSISRIISSSFLLALVVTARARAQTTSHDEPVCLGFSFGAWQPALNWRAAGHQTTLDTARHEGAPGGRDWALPPTDGAADSLIVLFPSWWPVGVSIALPTRVPAPGDTVSGKAIAFRAQGDSASPTARVRAWRVPCGSR